ncbi:lipopolysaccharide heptosyltransferase II [Candidatus Thioglobus sp.]|nr:lipopolysaccharide heptosyltransferase II [Candidatus Thioglobus sp.]
MRVLIELPTWLGDAVMATPAIENLINFYKDSEVVLIGSPIPIEIFKNHPNISEMHILNKNYISLFMDARKLGRFDISFSFRSSFRATLLKFFISSGNKYQYKRDEFQNCHQVEKYNHFVNSALSEDFLVGQLIVHSKNLFKESSKLIKKHKPLLGINPGASYGNAKRWYPKEFAEVAIKLSKQFDIVLFGGDGEKDISKDVEKLLIEKGVTNFKNITGKTSITELIQYISNLDLFITGDSGPMHIAASFQVPSITIFGPTRDSETSQWMANKSIIVKKNLECQPCMKRVCPLKHHNCMKLIKANDVIQAVNSLKLS